MDEFNSKAVEKVFNAYPETIRKKILFLRQLILELAEERDIILETLKWGEPSYLNKHGSTIRLGWKNAKPDQYAMYFHCKTKLVDTFKELYKDEFNYEGNRAIVFNIEDKVSVNELRHCISLALNYHQLKHLPLLGS